MKVNTRKAARAAGIGLLGVLVGLGLSGSQEPGEAQTAEVERVVEVEVEVEVVTVPDECIAAIVEARQTFGTVGEIFGVVAIILEAIPTSLIEVALFGDVSEATVATIERSVGMIEALEGSINPTGFVNAAAACEAHAAS